MFFGRGDPDPAGFRGYLDETDPFTTRKKDYLSKYSRKVVVKGKPIIVWKRLEEYGKRPGDIVPSLGGILDCKQFHDIDEEYMIGERVPVIVGFEGYGVVWVNEFGKYIKIEFNTLTQHYPKPKTAKDWKKEIEDRQLKDSRQIPIGNSQSLINALTQIYGKKNPVEERFKEFLRGKEIKFEYIKPKNKINPYFIIFGYALMKIWDALKKFWKWLKGPSMKVTLQTIHEAITDLNESPRDRILKLQQEMVKIAGGKGFVIPGENETITWTDDYTPISPELHQARGRIRNDSTIKHYDIMTPAKDKPKKKPKKKRMQCPFCMTTRKYPVRGPIFCAYCGIPLRIDFTVWRSKK